MRFFWQINFYYAENRLLTWTALTSITKFFLIASIGGAFPSSISFRNSTPLPRSYSNTALSSRTFFSFSLNTAFWEFNSLIFSAAKTSFFLISLTFASYNLSTKCYLALTISLCSSIRAFTRSAASSADSALSFIRFFSIFVPLSRARSRNFLESTSLLSISSSRASIADLLFCYRRIMELLRFTLILY